VVSNFDDSEFSLC
jgi:hypothetical protein